MVDFDDGGGGDCDVDVCHDDVGDMTINVNIKIIAGDKDDDDGSDDQFELYCIIMICDDG